MNLYTCWQCTKTIAHTGLCHRCSYEAWARFMNAAALGLIFSVLILCGCASQPVKAYRVRFPSLKLDVIAYETEAQVSRQCQKHIAAWERATGGTHRLDDGTFASARQEYRGCRVPPLHDGLNSHLLTSLETIDNLVHELCHALGALPETCDAIHFDGRFNPGRTVVIEAGK